MKIGRDQVFGAGRWMLVLGLVLGCGSALAQTERGPLDIVAPLPFENPVGAIFASDKVLHVGGSAAIVVAVYGASATFFDSAWARGTVAAAVSAAAGVGKEAVDVFRGGRADVLDLAADAIGIGVGLSLMLALEAIFSLLRADIVDELEPETAPTRGLQQTWLRATPDEWLE